MYFPIQFEQQGIDSYEQITDEILQKKHDISKDAGTLRVHLEHMAGELLLLWW